MSRHAKRHAVLNPPPKLTFSGDSLDRVLEGYYNDDLRKQLGKAQAPLAVATLPTPFEPVAFPLEAVFFNNTCECCQGKAIVFGYFARKTKEITGYGEITRHRIIADPNGEVVRLIQFQDKAVPYCGECVSLLILSVKGLT